MRIGRRERGPPSGACGGPSREMSPGPGDYGCITYAGVPAGPRARGRGVFVLSLARLKIGRRMSRSCVLRRRAGLRESTALRPRDSVQTEAGERGLRRRKGSDCGVKNSVLRAIL
jgi:hypothetical protein